MIGKEKDLNGYKLEICANSITSAIAAEEGGASRVELCQNLENGGTTPSYGQIRITRERLSIGIHVLIRPRGGDFLYSDDEFNEILADVTYCKEIKCDGVVVGILDKEGNVDLPRMQKIIETARPLKVVFHRAFDKCRDPYSSLEDIISLGCDRILTSGQANTAWEGRELLHELIGKAEGRIEIMPGGGVNEDNIAELLSYTQALSAHSSAKEDVASGMLYKDNKVAGMDEGTVLSSTKKVRLMADILKKPLKLR
ncbi:copper homeostasis protein CutC [Sphingobacterium spiritivorum]|uniref:copper homeostasis protein CutC n=1 Tax=Sphingobacterium spiritivorum TaxID=258 RepID=UPI003DA60746